MCVCFQNTKQKFFNSYLQKSREFMQQKFAKGPVYIMLAMENESLYPNFQQNDLFLQRGTPGDGSGGSLVHFEPKNFCQLRFSTLLTIQLLTSFRGYKNILVQKAAVQKGEILILQCEKAKVQEREKCKMVVEALICPRIRLDCVKKSLQYMCLVDFNWHFTSETCMF